MEKTQTESGNWAHYNDSLFSIVKSKALHNGDIEKAFNQITEAAAIVLNVERSSIWLYAEDHTKLYCADLFERESDHHSNGTELFAVDFPDYFGALEENRAIDADDAHRDPRTREFSQTYLNPLGISSMLDASIHFDGQTYGVICFEHTGLARHWSPEEITYAGSLADLASLALGARDRKKSERKLRESEERFRAVVDNSPAKIHIKDADGRYVLLNRVAEKLFGVTDEEARGKTTQELFSPAVATKFIKHDRAVLQSGQAVHEEEAWPEEDGTHTYLTVKFPIKNAAGQVLAIGAIGTDITEHKRAEDEKERQRLLLESLIENIPANVTLKDTDGRYVFVNQRTVDYARNHVGYSAEDFSGKTSDEIFGSGTADTVEKYTRQVMETGVPLFGIERNGVVTKDIIFSTDFVPIKGATGNLEGILTISVDITEQKRAEEQLHQSQKMEAVGQLTGGVAHDFNNLLTVILGNLELIAMKLDDPSIDQMAQSAIRASRRGAELTQRLLAFSRRQTLTPEVIELDQLVAGLTELMRRTLGESIEIEVKGFDDLWLCEADTGQLENTILNLSLNARDAMPHGGTLTIETANVKPDNGDVATRNEVPPGEYVRVTVSDTGIGMSRDVIDHAFEPFFTTKDIGAGSGLGLSMVHGFISQSGGYVTIRSTEGIGTTVNLYLPRSFKSCAPAKQSPKKKPPVPRDKKILLVEDDPDVRAMTVNMFASLGYDTVEAADGKEAIELLKQTPEIDLLFTDIGLPDGVSGVDVAREAIHHFPDIKILFASGYADDVLTRHGQIDADTEFVHKPFSMDDLARKLHAAMDKSLQ